MVQWVVGSNLHGRPIELFLIPASGVIQTEIPSVCDTLNDTDCVIQTV